MEILWVFVSACLVGTIVGLLPGISVFYAIVLSIPFLDGLEPISMAIYYSVVVCLSQFFGSVSATILGIPGEATSFPSLIEGNRLYNSGKGKEAILFATLGSFFTSTTSIIIVIFLLYSFGLNYGVMKSGVILILLLSASLMVVFSSFKYREIIKNIVSFGIGIFLAEIGYDAYTGDSFFTFNISQLNSGIPIESAIFGIIIVPEIIKLFKTRAKEFHPVDIKISDYPKTFLYIIKTKNFRNALLMSNFIGFLSGFIPALTSIVGTLLSYSLQKNIEIKNKRYDNNGNLASLLAAESSNNSSIYTQLIPLLLLGIPITASESVINSLFMRNGADALNGYFVEHFGFITLMFFLASLWGLIGSGIFASKICYVLSKINLKTFYIVVGILILGATYVSGLQVHAEWYYIIISIIMCSVGMLLRNFNTMPLIYAFLMWGSLEKNINRVILIYF